MATAVTTEVGTYRVLYFQPTPEDGERVCVAVLVAGGRDVTLLFDDQFQKLHCIAPNIDSQLVKFYLEDLRQALDDSDAVPIEIVLARYTPQLLASEERKIALPLTERAKLQLLERFVVPHSPEVVRESSPRKEQQTREHIRMFVEESTRGAKMSLILNATPGDIFGVRARSTRIGRVALAIDKGPRVVLIDGVDLGVLGPVRALTRATKVVHTFWNYGRLSQIGLYSGKESIDRIGVVLNGASHKNAAYRDAHDFVLHEFSREADLAVDSSLTEHREQMAAMLAQ